MTEAEWSVCTNPTTMLEFLRGKASDRKLRLFAVACCRHFGRQMPNERIGRVVETIEQYADGAVSHGELLGSRASAWEAASESWQQGRLADGDAARVAWAAASVENHAVHASNAARLAAWALAKSPHRPEALTEIETRRSWDEARLTQHHHECGFLRDIFGNPFRPITLDPAWLTANVVGLAQSIYEERAFDRLPILADALEDAGCTQAELLKHCRETGEHVRGCWLVDLVLAKS